MSPTAFMKWLRGFNRPTTRKPLAQLLRSQVFLEQLETRDLRATAVFNSGILTVSGDNLDNDLLVTRNAAGTLLVTDDGNPVAITGGTATVGNTTRIDV